MEKARIDAKILLIGAGKMGGALLSGWLHKHLRPEDISVLETNAAQAEKFVGEGIRVISKLAEVTEAPDIIVLAVKPQSMDALLPELSQHFPPQDDVAPFYLSIAAGKTLDYFGNRLGSAPVVRAMPNTPALIRKGITALIANEKTSTSQKQLAEAMMQAAGEVVWLENESQMDAVTAVSGSGPAYVFLFLEALVAAGQKQGLSEEFATRLALQTVRGSTKLAMKSDEPLAQLRKNVTSPGGTTEAALKVLMKEDALASLLEAAVAAAATRSKELA